MTNVRKMALVDPRLLETLRNPMQPPVDTTLRDLDADMTNILDRTDIEVSDKVRLYNQALLRYNGMTKTRANKPTRVVVVREEKVVNGEDVCAAEIVATIPKSLHMKARVLTARLKRWWIGTTEASYYTKASRYPVSCYLVVPSSGQEIETQPETLYCAPLVWLN